MNKSEHKPDKLKLSTKLAFGAGDFGTALTANILIFFLLPFFTDVAGIRPSVAGGILAVSKIWDAINDPIVGVLSDRTRTKWGRRRPWMFVAAIPFGLSFLGQWWVPFPNNETALIVYYVAIAILFNTFFTCVNLPYTALTPELTQDYDERTSLNSFRFAFSIVASIISGVLHPSIVAFFPNKATGYLVAGALWSVVSVLPIFWCVWGTREKYRQEVSEEIPFFSQLKIAFSNRPYMYVIGIYICSWLAFQNTATIVPFFVTYWMRKPEYVGLTILAVQGTALIMLFVWAKISEKIGKKAVYVTGMTVWIFAQIGLYFLQPDQLPLMFILAMLAGVGVSTAYMIPWSMIADVIELDELNTGQRREGIFYGFMVLLQKVGLAIAILLVGFALDYAGFIKPVGNEFMEQPEAVLLTLRIMIAPLPTLFLILGIGLTALYPITREVHSEILARLMERKNTSVITEEA